MAKGEVRRSTKIVLASQRVVFLLAGGDSDELDVTCPRVRELQTRLNRVWAKFSVVGQEK